MKVWQDMLKEVRSPGRTMSFRVEGSFSSPASLRLSRLVGKRRGEAMSGGHRGKGAGWYTRHQAAMVIKDKRLKTYYHRLFVLKGGAMCGLETAPPFCQSHPAILSVSSANLPYFALWHNVWYWISECFEKETRTQDKRPRITLNGITLLTIQNYLVFHPSSFILHPNKEY